MRFRIKKISITYNAELVAAVSVCSERVLLNCTSGVIILTQLGMLNLLLAEEHASHTALANVWLLSE